MNNANPVTVGSVILGSVTATIGLITSFGVALNEQQTGAIMTFMGAMIGLGGLLLHSRIVTKDTATNAVEAALNTSPAPDTEQQSKEILAKSKV